MTTIESLVNGEARTWEGAAIPTLNGYEIFYGAIAKEIWGDLEPYSEEGIAAFKAWCAEHNIAYWAAPREEFFAYNGAEYAINKGAAYLILEDLS